MNSWHNILIEGSEDWSFSGVTSFGGPRACKELELPKAHSFHHEYNSMACTVEIVDDVYAAINHIHQHGRYVNDFSP